MPACSTTLSAKEWRPRSHDMDQGAARMFGEGSIYSESECAKGHVRGLDGVRSGTARNLETRCVRVPYSLAE